MDTTNRQEIDVFYLEYIEATVPEGCLMAQSCGLEMFVIPTDTGC